MKRLLHLISLLLIICLTACDVHEWPDLPKTVPFHLRLNYETDMTIWNHLYDGKYIKEQGLGETYNNLQQEGVIRYIIRAYPYSENQRSIQNYIQEFVYTKDISNGYDNEVTIDLLPGKYHLIVWSDLMLDNKSIFCYNAENFGQISLQGEHKGNNDYRDAFCGRSSISLSSSIIYQVPDTIDVVMKRPLAKFEIVSSDLSDFIKSNKNDINQYQAKIQYVGFMPNTYSIFTGKPVDSAVGVLFEQTIYELSNSEASLGFDYVFVGDEESVVTIKVGIYDNKGKQLSMSESINVPLQSNHHTILKGKFLMGNTSSGININTNYDGNYNLVFP